MFHSSDAPFFNLSYWKNEEFDSTLDEAIAKTVTDPETSQQLYIDAMNLLVDEAPGVFYFDTQAIFIIPNYIKGFQYNLNYPFVHYFFYELSSDQ
jgi:peptide/nickel transport system substrate-binding protein